MLDHPWLKQPPKYDFKMTEKEYQIMNLKNKLSDKNSEEDMNEMSELCESDTEIFNADSEDNDESDSDKEDDDEFYSIDEATKSRLQYGDYHETNDIEEMLPGPKYVNNSFTGPYPEDMSRPYVDKGPNP